MLLFLLGVSVVLLYIYFKIKFSYWSSRGIKGPRPWWFFGTLIEESFTRDGRALEERYFREYGPVFGTFLGQKPVFNTSVPEHIKQVLIDTDSFWNQGSFEINDDYLRHSIFFCKDDKWKTHRAAMSHHFTSSKLKSMIDHFKFCTDNFVKNVNELNKESENKAINTKPLMRCFGIDSISKFVFAVDVNSFKDSSEWANLAKRIGDVNLIQSFLQLFLPTTVSRLLKLNGVDVVPLNSLGRMFEKMVKQRRATGVKYGDLIETLDDAIDKGLEMSEPEKTANSLLAFSVGVETVSNGMCRIFQYLVENPECKERLYAEAKREFTDGIDYERLTQHQYLDAFINESLRLGTTVLVQERTAMKATKIGEFNIAEGTEIYLIPYIVHTSAEYWPDPKKFDPERFMDKSSSNPNRIETGTFLPFSTGRRACLGKLLATLVLKYLTVQVLLEYELKKPAGFKIEVESVRGFESVKSLPIIFERR